MSILTRFSYTACLLSCLVLSPVVASVPTAHLVDKDRVFDHSEQVAKYVRNRNALALCTAVGMLAGAGLCWWGAYKLFWPKSAAATTPDGLSDNNVAIAEALKNINASVEALKKASNPSTQSDEMAVVEVADEQTQTEVESNNSSTFYQKIASAGAKVGGGISAGASLAGLIVWTYMKTIPVKILDDTIIRGIRPKVESLGSFTDGIDRMVTKGWCFTKRCMKALKLPVDDFASSLHPLSVDFFIPRKTRIEPLLEELIQRSDKMDELSKQGGDNNVFVGDAGRCATELVLCLNDLVENFEILLGYMKCIADGGELGSVFAGQRARSVAEGVEFRLNTLVNELSVIVINAQNGNSKPGCRDLVSSFCMEFAKDRIAFASIEGVQEDAIEA